MISSVKLSHNILRPEMRSQRIELKLREKLMLKPPSPIPLSRPSTPHSKQDLQLLVKRMLRNKICQRKNRRT